jgi:hypothetical protein
MNSFKKNARIVGALFIITMILGVLEANIVAPLIQGPLEKIYPNENLVVVGAFLILFMAIGIVGIAIAIFPVIKKHNETIALTYLSFRIIESVFLIVGAIVSLFLITLSLQYINAGSPDASYFQIISILAIKVRYVSYQIAMTILGIGSLMVCYVLFQTKLVPRLISVVGLVGYALLLVSAVLEIFGMIDTRGSGMIMYLPGGIFELFLFPIWLIVKGFDSSAIYSDNA